ncbi:MAG: hypothetical protein ACRCUP_05270 [Mycoplasmatales bacterium]
MLKKLNLLGFCFALMCVFASFSDTGIVNSQTVDLHAEEIPEYQEMDAAVGRVWDAQAGTKYTKGEIIFANEREVIDHSGKTITLRDFYTVQQDFTANGDETWIDAGALFQFDGTYKIAFRIPIPMY